MSRTANRSIRFARNNSTKSAATPNTATMIAISIDGKVSGPTLSSLCLLLALSVACLDDGFDIASYVEVAFHIQAQGVAGLYEVFQNNIDDMLVENLYGAKRVDVELQALQFDAALIRHVIEA